MLFRSPRTLADAAAAGLRAALLVSNYSDRLGDFDTRAADLLLTHPGRIDAVAGQLAEHAVSLGVDRAVIDALSRCEPIPATGRRHELIVRFGHALLADHLVPQALFDEMRAEVGERGLMELASLFGHVLTSGCALITADYDPEPGAPVLPSRASLG